jgi:hypothetical protein
LGSGRRCQYTPWLGGGGKREQQRGQKSASDMVASGGDGDMMCKGDFLDWVLVWKEIW